MAALAVLLFHYTARDHGRWGEQLPAEVFPELSQVTRYGYLGVSLFFVISGFVILMSVWGRTPAQFLASRISRLYPAYWVAVLLTASLRAVWPAFGTVPLSDTLINLTMFQAAFGVGHVDGVYWTLWVELQFYLLMILAAWVGVSARRAVLWAAVVPLAFSALAWFWPALDERLTLLSWGNLFGAGMVLYVIHREGHTVGRWAVVTLNAAQAVGFAAARKVEVIEALVSSPEPASRAAMGVLTAVAVAVVAAVTLWPPVRDLPWAWLTLAGMLTYPTYLVHEYMGWALIDVLAPHLNRWLVLLVATVAVCALAWAIHVLVERPTARPLRTGVERLLTRGRS